MSAAEDRNVTRMVPPKEAARYSSWSITKLYRLISEGKIRAFKEGYSTLIDLDSIDAYKGSLPPVPPGGQKKFKP